LADDLRVLRASEIGEYVFCHRAWWLHRVQGIESTNREHMDAGTARHAAHGRAVQRADTLRRAAMFLLAFAFLFAVLFFAAVVFSPH
jgi:hypothetical protein